jgi:signal recognition particle subunit SRP54
MTGQDAVKSADEFHKRLGITGVISPRWMGPPRWRGLSIATSPASPSNSSASAEVRCLEPFPRSPPPHPGMGDILSFVERPKGVGKKASEMQRKLIENDPTLRTSMTSTW